MKNPMMQKVNSDYDGDENQNPTIPNGIKEKPMKPSAHPGFKAVAKNIASQGNYSMDAAKAILAAKSRGASPAAKKANPNLKRVK